MKRSDRNNGGLVNGTSNNELCISVDLKKKLTEISKVTGPHRHTKFVPVVGPGLEELDRIQNQRRKGPTPRNLKLYDDDSSEGSSVNRSYTADDFFDENELKATLRSTLGGEPCSNRVIEQRWKYIQQSAVATAAASAIEEEAEEKPKKKQANQEWFSKNIAMTSLVKHHKDTNGSAALNCIKEPENVGASLVPDSLDPDFFYREIKNTQPDDDFIVEHIGKVTVVPPRQFLIHNIEPEDFIFPRKNKK